MTKEEAIKELSVEYFGDNEKIREAKRMAIKALKQTDCGKCEYLVNDEIFDEDSGEEYDVSYCTKQQPYEDCISREAVKDIIHKYKNDGSCCLSWVSDSICELPSIQPNAKVGHWITLPPIKHIRQVGNYYRCSECAVSVMSELNYCPNCGAKMEVEK